MVGATESTTTRGTEASRDRSANDGNEARREDDRDDDLLCDVLVDHEVFAFDCAKRKKRISQNS